ncbi:hypothetical protein ACRWQL_00580 (plasmid) [Shewanella sp. HL-SH4]|uniref:hypothetical protein n=1 Tax=Shewanella TaxID=22 RepID=UPI003D7984C7
MRKSIYAKKNVSQPFWFYADTIHHQLDKDIVDSMIRGNEKCSTLMMLDPHFEQKTNKYHIEWTKDDIEMLLEGMFIRSLEILRNAVPGNELFKEEVVWQASPQFAEIARHLGYDVSVIRHEVKQIMKRYGKSSEIDSLLEFHHWSGLFAEMFKEQVNVKVTQQHLFKNLTVHCEGFYELTVLLQQIGEILDDLHLEGYSRTVLLESLAETINFI